MVKFVISRKSLWSGRQWGAVLLILNSDNQGYSPYKRKGHKKHLLTYFDWKTIEMRFVLFRYKCEE